MKVMYVLLLLSIFTATIAVGVADSGSHNGAIMAGRSTVAVTTNEQPLKRQLYPQRPRRQQQQQQTLNYRANYTADFQRLVHPTCTGDKPVLAIGCYGQYMTILNVSDPSIICRNEAFDDDFNGTSYVCINTCTEGDTCANVYMVNDAVSNAFDGPHGSIQFLCEGNSTRDVEAIFLLHSNSTIGTCSADPTATTQNNLRVARLGVSCPKMDTFSDREGNYVYDDTYFECRGSSISGDTGSTPNDSYACFNGRNCAGSACNFTFSQMIVATDVPSFANECVEILVPIGGYPTPAPQTQMLELPSIRVPTAPTFDTSASTDTKSGINTTIFAIFGGIAGGSAIAWIVMYIHRKGRNYVNIRKINSNAAGLRSGESLNQMVQGNSDQQLRVRASANNMCSAHRADEGAPPFRHDVEFKDQVRSVDDAFPATNAVQHVEERETIFQHLAYKDQARSVDPAMNVVQRVDEGAIPFRHDVEFKDQVRSVDHTFPVTNAAQHVDERATTFRHIVEYKDQVRSIDHSTPAVNIARCTVDDGAAPFRDDVPIATAVHVTDAARPIYHQLKPTPIRQNNTDVV